MKVFSKLNRIIIYLSLLIFVNSCEYSNHKIAKYPSQKSY